ncbi:hypothetical protein HanOQP8_Chr14g0510701 [Helianthus annuus]|nr:hypothetical protein HanOQP8_Chr14g0510701 [Helianthus annuus]
MVSKNAFLFTDGRLEYMEPENALLSSRFSLRLSATVEKGFVRAETMAYNDFVAESAAREKGLDVVTKLETELDSVEVDLDKGGFSLKRQLLDDRRFPKMHLELQRLLQVIAHGEQVFPGVKEKCSVKDWFGNEDIIT